MEIKAFFEKNTSTLTYVVWDEKTRDAVVIDPVLDFDPMSWRVYHESVDLIADFVGKERLQVHWIIDTHVHADHLSGMDALKQRIGAKTVISEHITAVQALFGEAFNLPGDFPTDGSQFDHLAKDGEALVAGSLEFTPIHTPGHTPACFSYQIEDAVFTGDALFMPDFGTGRCDFPKGSAEDLYDSIAGKLYQLPPETRAFVGHDYQPGGRELMYETTIAESMASNKQLTAQTTREQFVKFRSERDATLSPPKLILQSLQVNIAAGRLPATEGNGRHYLKMPLGFFD